MREAVSTFIFEVFDEIYALADECGMNLDKPSDVLKMKNLMEGMSEHLVSRGAGDERVEAVASAFRNAALAIYLSATKTPANANFVLGTDSIN